MHKPKNAIQLLKLLVVNLRTYLLKCSEILRSAFLLFYPQVVRTDHLNECSFKIAEKNRLGKAFS